MKTFLILLLTLISASAHSADYSKLQRYVESYFRGATELPYIVSRNPLRSKVFSLENNAILRIELDMFENPFRQGAAVITDISQAFGSDANDTDYVEIYMYSEYREFNCSVLFRNSRVVSFENCRTRELDYGTWMPLAEVKY